MKTFDSLDELWLDVADDCLTNGARIGSRDGECVEQLGVCVRLADPRSCFMFNPVRAQSPSYAAAELIWYLSGTDNAAMICEYAPSYARFLNERRSIVGQDEYEGQKFAWGAYGKRLMPHFPSILNELKVKPESRQVVVPLFRLPDIAAIEKGLGGEPCKDIPCTLTVQFLLRDGRLCMITNMRSNDVWLGLTNDVFCWCHIQMIAAMYLNVGLGWYQHQAGSMHVYARNEAKTREALTVGFETSPLDYVRSVSVAENIQHTVRMEIWNRRTKVMAEASSVGGEGSLWTQVLAMAASKWCDSSKWIHNRNLRKVVENQWSRS